MGCEVHCAAYPHTYTSYIAHRHHFSNSLNWLRISKEHFSNCFLAIFKYGYIHFNAVYFSSSSASSLSSSSFFFVESLAWTRLHCLFFFHFSFLSSLFNEFQWKILVASRIRSFTKSKMKKT